VETGIVYKWTNKINGKWYIGSHKGTAEDRYTASGTLVLAAFRKYGIDNFSREILYEGEDYRELEEFILSELNAKDNLKSYNLRNTAEGGDTLSTHPNKAEIIKKISQANKGKSKSPEHIESMKQASNSGRFKKGQEPHNKGINPETAATRERRLRKDFIPIEESVAKANKTKKERGYTNGKLGTTRTEESKRKTAEAVKRSWEKRKQQKPN